MALGNGRVAQRMEPTPQTVYTQHTSKTRSTALTLSRLADVGDVRRGIFSGRMTRRHLLTTFTRWHGHSPLFLHASPSSGALSRLLWQWPFCAAASSLVNSSTRTDLNRKVVASVLVVGRGERPTQAHKNTIWPKFSWIQLTKFPLPV